MIKHLEICSEVGEKAYREAKIEEQLKGIEMKWKEKSHVSVKGLNKKKNTIERPLWRH